MSFKVIVIDNKDSSCVLQEDNVECLLGGYTVRKDDDSAVSMSLCMVRSSLVGISGSIGAVYASLDEVFNRQPELRDYNSVLKGFAFDTEDELKDALKAMGIRR